MSKDESAGAQGVKGRLRKATEEFIPEIEKPQSVWSFNVSGLHSADIIKEWNIEFMTDLVVVGKYKFIAEFPRLQSYKDAAEVRKKFEGTHHYNSDKLKPSVFEKAIFVFIQAEAYDDLHKVGEA